MSEQAKMKVGQIGVGGFGGARRGWMRQTGLFELVACYDINEKAMASAAKQDGATPVDSYEALLATPELEAIVISTGAKFHAEQIIQAAEKGLHVFVEKPLCSTMAEAKALVALQKRTGVVIGMGHCDHSQSASSLTIKKMIDSGEIGEVAAFEKTTAHSGGQMIKPGDWRGDPEKNPGGMLFQCGVHGVHELVYYFGPVARVWSAMRYDILSTQTADVALCHLFFESGLVGTLNAYHTSPYRHTLSIFGTKANIYRNDRFFEEGTELLCQTTHLDGKHEPMVPVALIADDNPCGNLESFYEAVRGKAAPYPSLIDGARAVAAVFAAEQSAKEGRPVDVPKF